MYSAAPVAGETPQIKAIVVLDGDGKRIVARYFGKDFASSTEELAFEKKLFEKTMRTNAKNEAEIVMFDSLVSVYRNSSECWFYVVGSQWENELILVNALLALHEALSSALRTTPDKRSLLDNFDTLLLTIDELIDGGMIMESDAAAITNRVGMKGAEGVPPAGAPEGAGATFTEGASAINSKELAGRMMKLFYQ